MWLSLPWLIFALLTWFKQELPALCSIAHNTSRRSLYLPPVSFSFISPLLFCKVFFAIPAFCLVVIFRRLTRFFWETGHAGNIGEKIPIAVRTERNDGIIAQTAGTLAKKRIGALDCSAGDDPLTGISMAEQLRRTCQRIAFRKSFRSSFHRPRMGP